MTHLIGEGSLFDADMDFMDRLVRHRQNPTDSDLNNSLFDHYLGVARDYWYQCRTKIEHASVEAFVFLYFRYLEDVIPEYKPSDPSTQEVNLNYIRTHFDQYDLTFRALLQEVQNNFQQTQAFNTLDLLRVFMYIARLICLDPHPSTRGLNLPRLSYYMTPATIGGLYLLTNTTGIFGFNSYLYAYIHGVNLVGFPANDQQIEGETPLCPASFSIHDLDHISKQDGHLDPLLSFGSYYPPNLYKNNLNRIYFGILNSNLSRLEKEAMILTLWIRLHEAAANDFVVVDPQRFIVSVVMLTMWSIENNMFDEFRPYLDLIMTEANIASTVSLLESVDVALLPPDVHQIYDRNRTYLLTQSLPQARNYIATQNPDYIDTYIYYLLMVYAYTYMIGLK